MFLLIAVRVRSPYRTEFAEGETFDVCDDFQVNFT